MLKLKRVAVTGSLASGKTTVCNFFREWGAYVVSADALLHDTFSFDTPVGRKIHSLFGDAVVEGTSINRSKVAEIVLHSPNLLTKLEALCHPYVNQEIQKQYQKASEEGQHSLFVAEVPLLFESRYSLKAWFDATIVVVSSKENSKQRYLEKGGTAEQFEFRESRCMPLDEKIQLAGHSLINNGSLLSLKNQTKTVFKKLSQKNP